MNWLTILIIIIIMILLILYFVNGYVLLYIVNMILCPFSNNSAYVSTDDIHWCKDLRNNYKDIRDEYISYTGNVNKLKRFSEIDPNQISTDTGEIPWNILMLRVYNKDTNKIKHFPKTYNFIKNIPGCSLAMFSVLHPGKKLAPHKGPYNGVLRYHLSLIIPDAPKEESNGCFIKVNDKNHYWVEGKDVMFDDTYTHSAENNTDKTRVVLFLDIKKNFKNVFLDYINDNVLYYGKFNDTVINIVNNTNDS